MKKKLFLILLFVLNVTFGQSASRTNTNYYNASPGHSAQSSVLFSGLPSNSTITSVSYETTVNHPFHSHLAAAISLTSSGTSSPRKVLYTTGSQGPNYGNLVKNGTTHVFDGYNPNRRFYFTVWNNGSTSNGFTAQIRRFKITVYYSVPNPNPPTGVSATTQSYSSIRISWNSVSGATRYRVYKSTSYSGSYSEVYSGSSTSYLNTGLNSNTTYYYKVKACSGSSNNSCSGYSNVVHATTSSNVPNVPTGLSAVAQSSSSIYIDWNSVSGAYRYRLYKSTSYSGSYSQIYSGGTSSYTNTGLNSNTTYYYKVKACSGNSSSSCSNYSNIVHATTNEPTPPSTTISGFGGSTATQVVVHWQYRNPYSRYKVYRSTTGPAGTFSYIGERTNVTGSQYCNYTDPNVSPSTEYCYKVKVCGTSVCSALSPAQCYTTTNLPPPTPYTVSGRVTYNGNGLSGVNVAFNSTQGSVQTTTNSSGFYSLDILQNASGNITPTLSGYDFSPTNIHITNLQSNLTNQNFTASPNTLAAPTLTATVSSSTSIHLSWNSVTGANYYKVYWSNGNSYSGAFIQNTYLDAINLTTGNQYCFYVVAYENSNGTGLVSPHSNTACATPSNSIPAPTVQLNSPNSGTFTVGQTMNINWTSTNQDHWEIDILENGVQIGKELSNSSNRLDTSYNWLIPATTTDDNNVVHTLNGNNYQIKVVVWNTNNAATAQHAFDISDNYLTIQPSNSNTPTVTLTYPTNAETFNVGDVVNIQWNSTNQSQYVVHLYEGGTSSNNKRAVIDVNYNSSAQSTSWQIPSTVTYNGTTYTLAGNDYKIRVKIKNSNNDEAEDFSDQFFTINGGNGCVYTDVPSNHPAYNAVTYLCGQGLLEDDGEADPDDPITRAALAKLAYLSIGLDNNTAVTDIVDAYPSPFQDLQDETTWFYSYAKNLSYLEYGDGKSPFDKTFFNFYASRHISRTHALKVLLETWNIQIQTGTGLPFTDVPVTHDNYEYIYTAYQLGIIDDNPQHIFGPDVDVYRSEIFIMLYRMMSTLGLTPPTPTINDFFITGNYTPRNFASYKGLHSGNFNHYVKTSFAISSVGIPLSYQHTYNSYLSEMPKYLTVIEPLGRMWTHTYNSYIQEIPGDIQNPNDFRVVVTLPNSGFHVYKLENGQYVSETKGVYNILTKPTADKFRITTKKQIVYTFQKLGGTSDDFPYVLVSVHDRNGNTMAIHYENSQDPNHPYFKRIKEVVGTSGRKLQFFYYPNTNKIDHIQDPLNRKVYYTYNSDGLLATFKDAKNQITYYNYGTTYVEKDLLMSIQLPKGNTVINTYQDKKLMSSKTNGNQPTTYNYVRNYGQSSNNNYTQTTVTNPQNQTTVIDYNKDGNPNHILKDNSTTVDITYDATHSTKPSNVTVNGKSAGMTYDNMGNVLSVTLPLGVSYHYTYNNYNDITQYTDPNGHNYNYTYNSNGNLVQTTTPRGSTTYNVNSKGLVTSVTNPEGITTHYTYDNYGNLTHTTAPEGISTASSYDMASRILSFTNPNGVTINYQYDANDNLLQETFNGHTTSYAFDPNDNLTQITNANGVATTMTYDFDNDFLTSVNFGNAHDNYTYYDDGKVHTYTNPNGDVFTYVYDTQGRLTNVNSSGANVSYTYDNYNNILSVTNPNGTITYTYDALNRITTTTDYFGNTVSYNYDANSNVTKITYPGNKEVNYTYYDDNLLHTVTDWNNHTTTYSYRNDGLISNIHYSNGTHCDYTYDNAGRQTGLSWKKSDGTVINEYTYALDAMGNHVSETKTEPFTPSAVTNDNISYSYDNTNKLLSANGNNNVSFGYDSNGNTTSKTGKSYTYDKYDNLISVAGSFNAQYQYDGQGNRRKSIVNGTEKRYVLDILGMSKVLMETDNSNTPQNYYIYGLGLISRIDANNNTNYYHYDFRGSTIAMTDANENITHKYEYNDFGQVVQTDEADFNPYRFVGKYGVAYEDEDLYFMRARYYDPKTGRFLSEDPIWSTNLYPYADNNPITGIDTNGKAPAFLVGAVYGAIARAILESPKIIENTVVGFTGIGVAIYGLITKDQEKILAASMALDDASKGLRDVTIDIWQAGAEGAVTSGIASGIGFSSVGGKLTTKLFGKTGVLPIGIDFRTLPGRGLKDIGHLVYEATKKETKEKIKTFFINLFKE